MYDFDWQQKSLSFPDRMDCDSSPESSDEVCHTQNNFSKPTRRDRSLFQLTTRFIGALRDSQDGLLDLNRVSDVSA